jgi:hypothetical protein
MANDTPVSREEFENSILGLMGIVNLQKLLLGGIIAHLKARQFIGSDWSDLMGQDALREARNQVQVAAEKLGPKSSLANFLKAYKDPAQ